MSETKRLPLKPKSELRLSRNPQAGHTEKWVITGLTGGETQSQGSSCICYDALLGDIPGRLKEFYPGDTSLNGQQWLFHFTRDEDNQLCPTGSAMERRFRELCADFLDAYHTLNQARLESPRHQLLNNYIPNFEILYGHHADGSPASVYIWTPNDKQGKNFEEYIQDIRREPKILPAHKLYNVLTALTTLSGCIQLLHEADLLHQDIKPSNFLVLYDSSFNIDSHSISMFDVNTLHSVYSDYPLICGSEGFTAPEVLDGEASFASDIYAIGAVLYHAILIDSDIPALYSRELYGRLEEFVAKSRLITASDSNSNIYLRDRLTTILRRTLAWSVTDRYLSCEELIADLEQARVQLMPKVYADKLDPRQWLASLDARNADTDPTAVIQELLYRYPLYKTVSADDPAIRVLTLGSGTYGQRFLDQCLQSGQMINHSLHITACSQNPDTDRRLYLADRPLISRFVNVDGSMGQDNPMRYGDLNFCPIPGGGAFTPGKTARNTELLRAIVNQCPENEHYHHIFIALGDDSLNQEIASILTEQLGIRPETCVVSYVLQQGDAPEKEKAVSVMVNRSLSASDIFPDLKRMGFNTHLCWCDSLNLDLHEVRQKYMQDKYSRSSSQTYVLSIRSKLASVGIYEADPVRAAELFRKRIIDHRNDSAKEEFDRLVALEHRRWVLEKVVNGWQGLTTLNGKPDYASLAARSLTKDTGARRHPCLVFSTDQTPLNKFSRAQWDTPGAHDQQLDELDKMSVDLHRAFLALAKNFLQSQPMKKLDLDSIRTCLAEAPESVTREFQRYELCLKNILEGNENYSRSFQTYQDDFKKALGRMPLAVQEKVKSRLDQIRSSLTCVIESNLCRDYKQLDDKLVTKIPFILTYQPQPYMAMAFDDGRFENGKNSAVFNSVASATMINPYKITYLYYFDEHSRAELLLRKADSVLTYFSRRNMYCKAAFLIAFAPGVSLQATEILKSGFQALQGRSRLEGVKFHSPETEEKAQSWFASELKTRAVALYDCSVPVFPSSRREKTFLARFTGKIPNFEFDWKRREFLDTDRCDYLNYIDENAFIRIDDMFALMNAGDNRYYYPEFTDVYRALWRVYTGDAYLSGSYSFTNGVNNWIRLCNNLEEFSKTNDVVCEICYPVGERISQTPLEYFLPDTLHSPMEQILTEFKRLGVIRASSGIYSCSSDLCRLVVHAEHDVEGAFNKLIDLLYDQADVPGLRVEHVTFRDKDPEKTLRLKVQVIRDNLTVKNLVLDSKFSLLVLEALHRLRMINQLRYHPREGVDKKMDAKPMVSFRYPSPRMKKLLTTAGEILEVYTYYEVKRQGYFDDIACSYEFRWESGDITNELDCVLTKGFRSVIVECKSRKDLSQDHYYKLWAIAEQFGIGTKKVLIANTYDTSNPVMLAENEHNRARGRQLGIITISDPDEIRNIGATLRAIVDGTYHQNN